LVLQGRRQEEAGYSNYLNTRLGLHRLDVLDWLLDVFILDRLLNVLNSLHRLLNVLGRGLTHEGGVRR
jgi:hypothetical protein